MNKRALMLTAASAALLTGHAYGASSPCSTTTSTTSPQLCDITSQYGNPIFTGTPSATVTNAAGNLGNVTIDTNGSLIISTSPPQAPAVTLNSGTTSAPTTVTNTTNLQYEGTSYAVGTLLEEASVPTSASAYGTAENWTGEFINTGTINMTGSGTNKVGILIAGGAYYQSSTSSSSSTSSVYSNASTGEYPNTAGSTTSPTGLGVFTGGNVVYNGGTPGASTSPVAIDLASGLLEIQGSASYGINLIGPTFSTNVSNVETPSGGATLIGDIDVGGNIELEPETTNSTAATSNVAINIAGWEQSASQTSNPALAGTAYAGSAYAMVGNLNILSSGVITSSGQGSEGIVVLGAIDGGIFNSGSIETYGTQTPSTAANAQNPEAGSALSIANNITGGIDNNGPSLKFVSSNTGTATISTIGTAPTINISPSVGSNADDYAVPITIGVVASDPDYANQFSLLNRGTITASSQDPNQNTYAINIAGSVGDPVTLTGGIFNAGTISSAATTNTLSGSTSVTTYALSIGSYANIGTGTDSYYGGGVTAALINTAETGSGKITATVSGPDFGVATAIDIQQNANLSSIFNSGVISASASTTTLTTTGTLNAFAIYDNSGTLSTITNEGTISASVTTLDSNSGLAVDPTNEAVAIDVASNSSTPVVVNDTATANSAASIAGDIFFGTKNATLNLSGINATDYANVTGDIYFENNTATHDVLSIGQSGTVTGQIFEQNGGLVDISIAQSGVLNYETAAPTNLNSTVVVSSVTKGTPLSVGNLVISNGGSLDISVSQGYNILTYPGSNIINAENATIGNPSGAIHPIEVTFGSFVAAPSGTGAAAEFVLVNSATPIVISTTELDDLASLYNGSHTAANGIPYLFTSSICAYDTTSSTAATTCATPAPANTVSSIVMTLSPKTIGAGTNQIPLTGYAARMFNYANQALLNDDTLGAAMVNDITNAQTAQAAYASFAPDVSGATRATAISLTDSASNVVAARQRELRMYANQEGETTLWGQQFAERLSQADTSTLTGYNDSGFGFVLGMDDGDTADGRYGGAFTFFGGGMSQHSPVDAKTASEYYLLTGYTDWRGKGLFIDTQATIGYGNLKGRRFLVLTDPSGGTYTRTADGNRPTELVSGSVTMGGIFTAGSSVFMPQVDVDGLTMREESYTESNGGDGFDLHVAPYYADSLRAFLGADMRQDFNFGDFYLQPELRFGYRYDFVNGGVKLRANFASVNSDNGQTYTPFTVEGPDPGRGNLVLGGGVAITTGSWSIGVSYDYLRAGDGPTEQTGVLTLVGRI